LQAVNRKLVLQERLNPPFNSEDKRLALAKYYHISPDTEFSQPIAELRRRRLRWRNLPDALRAVAPCVYCETQVSLELLDGDCAFCHYVARLNINRIKVRADGKNWSNS